MGFWKFVIFFIIALVAGIFILDAIDNHFVDAFVFALIIGFLAGVRD